MINPSLKRVGVARVINKAGLTSRSQAEQWVRAGQVQVNGKTVLDPEFPTTPSDKILCNGSPLTAIAPVYLMLNKPRGLITSAHDEQGRDTVFECLKGKNLPHVGPVGRLDKASEGLLLFTNDTQWSNTLLDPTRGIVKTYHVQVQGIPDQSVISQMCQGIEDKGELLVAKSVCVIRQGERNAWLEVKLDEGKNREIRRLLKHFHFETLRLIRVAIGDLPLGDLPKGSVRLLTPTEVNSNLL